MTRPETLRGYSAGRWMIERERWGIEAYCPPPAPTCDGVQVASGVPEVLKALGVKTEGWASALAGEWAALVGVQVAKHTRPGRLQGVELTVYVDSSVWLGELSRYGLNAMLANIQARFGTESVRKIRLQLNPDG